MKVSIRKTIRSSNMHFIITRVSKIVVELTFKRDFIKRVNLAIVISLS